MRHARKTPTHKKATPYVAGLSLLALTGFCIGGLLSDGEEAPGKTESQTVGPEIPGPSDEAPKTAEEGQARKDQAVGSVSESQSPENRTESRSPALAEADATKPSTDSEKGSQSQEKPSTETPVKPGITATPSPGEPTASPTETEKPSNPPKPKPEKPVYEFFIANDSEQNRTWCDTRPSGSVKVEVGRVYRSYYDDKDPAKAFESYGFSKEDTTCP